MSPGKPSYSIFFITSPFELGQSGDTDYVQALMRFTGGLHLPTPKIDDAVYPTLKRYLRAYPSEKKPSELEESYRGQTVSYRC